MENHQISSEQQQTFSTTTTSSNNERSLSKRYESLDYDLIENVVNLEYLHKSKFNNFINRDLQKWLVIFIIGLATAISGFFAGFAVNYLTRIKITQIIQMAESNCHQNSTSLQAEPLTGIQLVKCMSLPYLTWLAWNILPSLIGSLMVTYIAPVASGSGIPVVKCYLNGVKIPEVVRFKTYVTKLLGVVASVVGGLAVGKEGPFIHCGAVLGAGLSQGKSTTFKWDTKLFRSFRNDRDKRDFVSAGASAGVSTAFGAPIGGVLFALEEGASYWNQPLTLLIFACSMQTSFVLNLLMSAYNHNAGILAFYSLVNFGLVEELDYFWFEIPVYICIGIVGGLVGASFCHINLMITKFRKRYISKSWMKVLEVVIVASITATAGISLILLAPDCQTLPKNISKLSTHSNNHSRTIFGIYPPSLLWSDKKLGRTNHLVTYSPEDEAKKALNGHIITSICPHGEYSAMSSLWLKTSEGASSTFMVLQDDIWSIKTLALFLVVYYALAVITYGMSISSGIFIPSLLIGATGGRLIGLILQHFFGRLEWLTQLNKFAIIGAASVLGGVVRMTISLTVIIIEATGCISFGLPIMICLMVAKWVADSFIEGLYDLAIHMANVPFLDWEPPTRSYSIYASDAMSHNVKAFRTTETVAHIISILKSTSHNGFPVVDYDNDLPRRDSSTKLLSPTSNDYYTPQETPSRGFKNPFNQASDSSDTQALVSNSVGQSFNDSLIGSFQRCSITAKRESYGRFRGLVLRWQLLVMIELKIFNENERSFEMLSLNAFQSKYPRYPSLNQVISGLTEEMYDYHVDLRAIMNPTPYTVFYSASFPRIFRLFRSLGLRHLVVIDDRNQVVGMITRKDIARYVRKRDENGTYRFCELSYSP